MLRLVIKLLLSNIHLAINARERVVMINTFMALIRRPESAEGLIKNDGGPTSLGEFLTRLPSKE